MSDYAFILIMLGMAGIIAYIMHKDYINEQDFRRFHDRENSKNGLGGRT